MPFCSQCGTAVGDIDVYCGRCGARQPVNPQPGAAGRGSVEQALSGISPRMASILCYIPGLGWIAAIIVLAAQKFRTNQAVRFHAFQGLYLFVAWLLNQWVLRWIFWPIPHFGLHRVVELLLIATAVFMMVKASHDETYSLPIVGELASRSLAE